MAEQRIDYFGCKDQPKLYHNFRPEYPDDLVDYVAHSTKIRRTCEQKLSDTSQARQTCALDLACGTGLFTRKLAPKFERVFGTDISEGQLDEASSNAIESNISYARLSAYDIEATLEHFQIVASDVELVSIASAFHWLDQHRFFQNLVESIAKETTVCVVGYGVPTIMEPSSLSQDTYLKSSNPKIDLYNKWFQEILFGKFTKYMQVDLTGVFSKQSNLPFNSYFPNYDYKEFLVVKKSSLYDLVQFLRSMSFYRAFWNDNQTEIRNGAVEDPVALFAARVMKQENLIEETEKIDLENEIDVVALMKVNLDILWTFYVHVLSS